VICCHWQVDANLIVVFLIMLGLPYCYCNILFAHDFFFVVKKKATLYCQCLKM
jgi:hypothetical protein